MNTVGQILSTGRNSKNLSISDISIELKISKGIIVDLENDNIKNNSDILESFEIRVTSRANAVQKKDEGFTGWLGGGISFCLLYTSDAADE